MWRRATALVGVLLLAGCGTDAVVGEGRDSSPYDGPMRIEVSNADAASVGERSGAAARALECDGDAYNGGSGDYESGLAQPQGDEEDALDDWLEGDIFGSFPLAGYRLERDDGDRALYSYDVGGRSKVAVIVADGVTSVEGNTGWGVETWAQCDPAEFPASVTDALGIEVWTDEDGARVPISRIQSYPGPEHCDWQAITFLTLDQSASSSPHARQFLRDTDGELADYLTTTYAELDRVPGDARDTGLSRDGLRLWIGSEPRAAYLVDESGSVERWPAARGDIACA